VCGYIYGSSRVMTGVLLLLRATYPPSIITSDLGHEQHPYVEVGSIGAQTPLQPHSAMSMQNMSPITHDTSRRMSLYDSPTEFTALANSSIYSGGWQVATTAPSTTTMYAYTQQQQQQQQQQQLQLDSLPRPYDPNSTMSFRTALPHAMLSHSQTVSK
jgi:invasion protein IalB